MAFGNFSLITAYTAFATMLNTQLTAVGKLFKDQTTGDFVDQIRWSSSAKRFESWNGSAWVAIDISASTIATANDSSKLGGSLPVAFATATQGTKADNALPASSYTASDVLSKFNSISNGYQKTITLSSADPSGGNDGDVWIKYY